MRIALGGYRGRLVQDRAHILVYRRPYCIKNLFVNFMHLWVDVENRLSLRLQVPIEA